MKKKPLIILVILILAAVGIFLWKKGVFDAKGNASAVQTNTSQNPAAPAPAPIVVYKTSKDYSDFVSVVLSYDGASLDAYPAPSDAEFERPIALRDGYYIGRMPGAGNPDGAFTDMSIDDYSKTDPAAASALLLQHVADKSPFTEIYNCSLATTQAEMKTDIDGWIATDQLSEKCPRVL